MLTKMKYSITSEQITMTNQLFSSYWFYGDLEVLISQYDKEKAYILNNFLNLYSFGFDNFFLYFSIELKHRQMEIYKHCPFLDYRIIERNKQPLTIDAIKNWIDDGWSIIVYVRRTEFPGYSQYLSPHQIMIYGYDDVHHEFCFCDNSPNGRYKTDLICSYNAFLNGYKVVDEQATVDTTFEFENHCYLLKPHQCETYGIDLFKITSEIKMYLGLSPNEYAYIGNNDGFKIYDHIVDYLNGVIDLNYEFNYTLVSFSVLRDHKSVYMLLFCTLVSHGIIDDKHVSAYSRVVSYMEQIMSLLLMFCDSEKVNYLNRAAQIIGKMRDLEHDILCELIRDLECYLASSSPLVLK